MSTYTIQSGDSFWAIAQKLGISADDLVAANSTVNPTALQVGQVIRLPDHGGPGAGRPAERGDHHHHHHHHHHDNNGAIPGAHGGSRGGGGYEHYSGPASNYPAPDQWASYEALWAQNAALISHHANGAEVAMIKGAMEQVARESGVDVRCILVVVVQESGGNPRVRTTNNGVRNPGLMQSHDGVEFDPANPAESILQMVRDGTVGTPRGDGLMQLYARYGNWYEAFRAYNSGSVNRHDLNDPMGATADYVQKVANRLMGHSWPNM